MKTMKTVMLLVFCAGFCLIASCKVDQILPLPVSSLTVTAGTKKATLDWINPTATDGLVGINVAWSKGGTAVDSMDFTALVRTATIQDLEAGVEYVFAVSILDANGNASAAVEVNATPLRDALRFHVAAAAASAGDGSSWSTAFTSLETALEAAWVKGDEIWVAAGTYLPESWPTGGGAKAITSNARFRHFFLRPGVSLYGGFAGTETSLAERDWKTHPTILSGDFGNDDADADADGCPDAGTMTENAVHVIYVPDSLKLDSTAVLDGFIVSGGNADLPGHDCGGGMYLFGSSPTVRNCVFRANSAALAGGGLYAYGAGPVLDSVAFDGNRSVNNGGGLAVLGGDEAAEVPSVSITGCILYGNRAANHGGGLYVYNAKLAVHNSTMAANKATGTGSKGAGVMVQGSLADVDLADCILWANTFSNTETCQIDATDTMPACTNCVIEDGNFTGTGNGSTDPAFTDPADGNGADDAWFTADDGIRHP